MTLAFDLPQASESVLGRWDTRWKLAALVLAAVLMAFFRRLPPTVVAGFLTIPLATAARLPLRWYVARLGSVAALLLFFLAWLPFVHPGPRHDFGWIQVSPRGIEVAATLLVKALSVVSLMLCLLATSSLQDVGKAAHALRLPGVLVQIFLLTYRYLFLLADDFLRLRTALRVRGFRSGANLRTYRTVGHVAGTLLVRSHERAERVAQAMRCRGFDGQYRTLHEFRTRWSDVALFAAVVGAAAGLLVWDVLGRSA